MNLSFIPAINIDMIEVMDTMNKAFAGYIGGDLTFNLTSFEHFLTNEAINLNLSQLAVLDDKVVGLAFISRRGWSSRLAGMGITPEATGQGIAKGLLNHIIQAAQQRGDHSIVLESIEQNIPAINLYKSLGFRFQR